MDRPNVKLSLNMGFVLLLFGVLFLSFAEVVKKSSRQVSALERAYFEGQRDALTGDVRIEFDDRSKSWKWLKSCWDDGREVIFKP